MSEVQTITARELKALLDAGDQIVLVDTLHPMSFENEHIPGSINIPYDRLTEKITEKLPDKHARIIVYCASKECTASIIAADKLLAYGYTDVTDFEEGIEGWKAAGYTLEQGHA